MEIVIHKYESTIFDTFESVAWKRVKLESRQNVIPNFYSEPTIIELQFQKDLSNRT
jgi:hypothetical protein